MNRTNPQLVRAARISVIRAAARRMLDTDEYFFITVSRWLFDRADYAEYGAVDPDDHAYGIAEAYLESEDRLLRRLP